MAEILDLTIQVLSATGLPIRVTDTTQESCFIQLTALSDAEATENQNSQESVENISKSPLLKKQEIQHVGLKSRLSIQIENLFSVKVLNDILHGEKKILRLDVVKGEDVSQNATPETILATTYLDLSQLLHVNEFQQEIKFENKKEDPSAKGKKPVPAAKGKPAAVEETPLPAHTILTYSVQLHGRENIAPQKEKINFVNLSVGAIRNLPQSWIQPFLDVSASDEKKQELLKNHVFLYNVDFSIPCAVDGVLNDITFGSRNGKIIRENDSWDSISIVFDQPVSFYLNAETGKHFENMVFNKESFPITFYRVFNPQIVKDSTWEDYNKQKYTANILLKEGGVNGLAVYLEPGKKNHHFTSLPLTAEPPIVEIVQDDKKKAPPKEKAIKLPKDFPADLAPEPPLKEGESHPYEISGTNIELEISFEYPIIPLAQDRLGSHLKLEDLIPKRDPILKKIPAVESFKSQVGKVISQLAQQFEITQKQSANSNLNIKEKFIFDLNSNGLFFSIKDLLKKTVISIVEEKFASQKNSDPKQLQQFYNTVYVYLMEQVHEVLNKLYNGETTLKSLSESIDESQTVLKQVNELKRLALESEFEEDYTLATEFFQKRIELLPNDVELWHEFAIFNLRIRDEGKAEYCFRQALGLNITHENSLLDYSVLLIHQEHYDECQALLNALVDINEENLQAWIILSLLYECMDLHEDAQEAITHAKQILASQGTPISSHNLYYNVIHYILYSLQIDSVAELLLQKLQAESTSGSLNVLYGKMFLLRQDFERAEEKLKLVLERQNNNVDAWQLLGDVHFEQNHKQEARQAYELCIGISSENQVQNPHLFMRLGQLYLDLNNAEGALAMYQRATELWYCSLTLLGLGVSYFRSEKYQLAEQALNEANILDNRNIHVWAWLTIVNTLVEQYATAALCKLQMDRSSRSLKDHYLQKIFSQVKNIQDPEASVRSLKQVIENN